MPNRSESTSRQSTIANGSQRCEWRAPWSGRGLGVPFPITILAHWFFESFGTPCNRSHFQCRRWDCVYDLDRNGCFRGCVTIESPSNNGTRDGCAHTDSTPSAAAYRAVPRRIHGRRRWQGANSMELIPWLPGLFLLGLFALGLVFTFVWACEKV